MVLLGGVVSGTRPQGEPEREDPRRFEALFHRHADAVRAYALRRSDPDTAQEVVAETFAVAWRRRAAVPDPALPWLLGVARRVLSNERRSRGRAAALEVRLVREPASSADDPAGEVDARLSAQAALEGLERDEREVLELLAWEGLSVAQAAEVLGCSRASVTVRVGRARRRLYRLLDEPAPAPPLGDAHSFGPRRTDRIARAATSREADDDR
jgi:RNA polymerase sigma-70 factor (ECF subfamily)